MDEGKNKFRPPSMVPIASKFSIWVMDEGKKMNRDFYTFNIRNDP